MPKKTEDPSAAIFLQLGRFSVAAGIQYLKPRLEEYLTRELESLVNGAGTTLLDIPKPKRGPKALALATKSLERHVDKPTNQSTSQKEWWAKMTPAQRKAEVQRRQDVKDGKRKPKTERHNVEHPLMLDGRYTKQGAAAELGVSWKSLDYIIRSSGLEVPSVRARLPGGYRARVATYDPADINALRDARNGTSA